MAGAAGRHPAGGGPQRLTGARAAAPPTGRRAVPDSRRMSPLWALPLSLAALTALAAGLGALRLRQETVRTRRAVAGFAARRMAAERDR